MVSKARTQSRFSLSVRMKRSAQPFPSGARTKAGELAMPRKASSPLEGVGHVLAPVIVPDGETARDLFGESAEAAAHALADRLERLKAGRPARGMNAHALG